MTPDLPIGIDEVLVWRELRDAIESIPVKFTIRGLVKGVTVTLVHSETGAILHQQMAEKNDELVVDEVPPWTPVSVQVRHRNFLPFEIDTRTGEEGTGTIAYVQLLREG